MKFVKYGISAAVCGLMIWGYGAARDVFSQPLREQYRILCDAFTIPGVTFLMLWGLMRVSNTGFFDGLFYALTAAFRGLIPGGRRNFPKYADYVAERRERRGGGYGFLFAVGAVCLALGLIFMALFY